MHTPARVSISSARRGSVQFGRLATGPDKTSSATANANSALTGGGPRRDRFLQRLDPACHKGAAPDPNRILAHPERLGDLGRWSSPTG